MDTKMNRQQEWYLLGTLVAVFGGRFNGRIGDYAHHARFQLKTAVELADGETERKRRLIGQADSLLSRMMNETELLLMSCGCAVWSEEDERYLEMMSQRIEPFEDGADGAAVFSRAVLKERERFGRWLLAEDMSLALNGLLVLAGRLRRLLRHERKRLAEETETACGGNGRGEASRLVSRSRRRAVMPRLRFADASADREERGERGQPFLGLHAVSRLPRRPRDH